MNRVVLSTTYLGPVQWYQKLHRADDVLLEAHERFIKQTYRNRCLILGTNGVQALTLPLVHGDSRDIRDVRLSDHGRWQHLHWQALQSAYGESPFFEFYADDLRPFYEKHFDFLYDFNRQLTDTICQLLDVRPHITETACYTTTEEWSQQGVADYRDRIRPKHPDADPDFQPRPYYQVFRQKWGFMANLSIVDLLFNEGNEGIFFL